MLALAKAAPLKPEIRLAQAVSHFEADLSDEQKAVFRNVRSQSHRAPPDINDVMRLTAEVELRNNANGGAGRCFGPRLTNILQSIQQYAAIGDVIVGGSQNIIACGVWSLARLTLLSVAKFSSFLDKISTLLMVAGRLAPRYERMALLYPRSSALQSYLSEFFIVVVHLCHQIFRFTKKRLYGQFISALKDSEMHSYEIDLERWANSIREEVSILSIEEQRSHMTDLLQLSKSEARRRFIDKRCRILDHCSTYDYQTPWKQIRKKGNATLLQDNPDYEAWKASVVSFSVFWIGKLGCGKSVLLANIVDDLNLHERITKCPVAYFFCRHDIAESLLASTIIGSLAQQLLRSVADLSGIEDLPDNNSSVRDSGALCGLLIQTLSPKFTAYFVLDGLDECDNYQRDVLVEALSRLQKSFSLRLCLSLRSGGPFSTKQLPNLTTKCVTVAISDDNPDIESFISAELERRIESRQLAIGDPTLIIDIHDSLVSGAQGMFLWVVLQIESLCIAKTDKEIRHTLATLPRDLPETFTCILQTSAQLGEPYQERTLALLTAAMRPFTAAELRDALSVFPGDTNWDSAQQLNDVNSALATCGCLVTIDEETMAVGLIHHSVKQFLLGDYGSSNGMRFTKGRAQSIVAGILVTYLNYGIFETEVSRAAFSNNTVSITPSRIIQSVGISNTAQSVALHLLKSKRSPEFQLAKAIDEAKRQFNMPTAQQYPFYSYARSYWLHHVYSISEKDQIQHRLLLDLLRRNIVDIDTRDSGGRTLLLWAAENGSTAIVKLLIEKGAVLTYRDNRNDTALILAVNNLHIDVVKLLFSGGAELINQYNDSLLSKAVNLGSAALVQLLLEKVVDLHANDYQNVIFQAVRGGHHTVFKLLIEKLTAGIASVSQKALLLAAEGGNEAIVKLLIERNVDLGSSEGQEALYTSLLRGHENVSKMLIGHGINARSTDVTGKMAIQLAAKDGQEAIVALLIGEGANLESKNSLGYTALACAAKEGHAAIVLLLIDKGAYIDSKDKDGLTVLASAASQGHEAITRLLIHNGAKINSKDRNGMTVLACAAREGRTDIIKLLIDNGAELNSNDQSSKTALASAAAAGQEAAARLLISRGADVNRICGHGMTALAFAARGGHEALVSLLIDNGAHVNHKGAEGMTALAFAVQQGHKAAVGLLIDKGASVDVKNANGMTALALATEEGHEAIVRLLVDNGANVNSKDSEGVTVLTIAAAEGNVDTIRLLIVKGANLRGNDGQAAISVAAEGGNGAVVKVFNENGLYRKRSLRPGR